MEDSTKYMIACKQSNGELQRGILCDIKTGEAIGFTEKQAYDVKLAYIRTGKFPEGLDWGDGKRKEA